MKYKKGFTLIELLVVVAIIALVSSIVLGSVNQARKKAVIAAALASIHQVDKVIHAYYAEFGRFPGSCIGPSCRICHNGSQNRWPPPDLATFTIKIPTNASIKGIVNSAGLPDCVYYYGAPKDYEFDFMLQVSSLKELIGINTILRASYNTNTPSITPIDASPCSWYDEDLIECYLQVSDTIEDDE